MTWQELLAEYYADVVGPGIMAAVERICRQVAHRYPPTVYAAPAHRWDDDAYHDLLLDVVTERLLGEHQLEYIVATSRGIEDFERLVVLQVKRTLYRRRQWSVVDNLLTRAVALLREDPFEEISGLSPSRFRLIGAAVEHRAPVVQELRAAALMARAVPRMRVRSPSERAPVVYRSPELRAVLVGIARTLPTSLTMRDLDDILRLLLTDLIPRDLDDSEDVGDAGDRSIDEPAIAATVADVVERLLELFNPEQVQIMRMKAADIADTEVADKLGMSRPTLASRKHAVFQLVRTETDGLDQADRDQVVDLLVTRIVEAAPEW